MEEMRKIELRNGGRMKFIYGKNDWNNFDRGQENCYLLTNGLGGYSSMTMVGSITRNDHALLMSCIHAPNHRYHMVTRTDETIQIGEKQYPISSQEYVTFTKNLTGYVNQQQFYYEDFPNWIYQTEGIEIKKTIVMSYGENTIGIRYQFDNRMEETAKLSILPQLQFVPKGESMPKGQCFETTKESVKSNGLELFYKTNAEVNIYETEYTEDLYYAHDARDGREAIGKVANNHSLSFTILPNQETECYLIYSTKPIALSFEQMFENEKKRLSALALQSQIADKIGLQLVKSADQFIVDRESTNGKSIMAGYPFFADWGRDTMISLVGCCISTRRFEEAKNIFRTFMKYCRKGLMPNMFPEGENEPWYNTVDASLLFIGAVYEYYLESGDGEFVREAYPTMEEIIEWYQKGTEFHIRMDQDGLLLAGSGLEQVTWMDVRFGEILPTPRHGKPVEINAYWYNDLKIMGIFARLQDKDGNWYDSLAEKVKQSFCNQFWNEKYNCLKDVISGGASDDQIRCNQIWAVSLPYTMLPPEQEKQVVDKVFEKLYTPYGLRTLNKEDNDFKPVYGGAHFNRDMAYHQGTVWTFPLGGYYLAYLKVNKDSAKAVNKVKEQLSVMEACMREGCIGQLAEIYDGETPTKSQGCFAQAWSVSEILRVYAKLEKVKKA
jgi:predicted glycogen debranching enzyme